MYQLKMSSGDKYKITEKEAQELMIGSKKGLIGISSLRGVVNMSFVESIVPEDKIDNSKIKEGYLHDGTKVIKKYGEWVDANNPDVRLDRNYYPEIARDEVISVEEYNKKLLK